MIFRRTFSRGVLSVSWPAGAWPASLSVTPPPFRPSPSTTSTVKEEKQGTFQGGSIETSFRRSHSEILLTAMFPLKHLQVLSRPAVADDVRHFPPSTCYLTGRWGSSVSSCSSPRRYGSETPSLQRLPCWLMFVQHIPWRPAGCSC